MIVFLFEFTRFLQFLFLNWRSVLGRRCMCIVYITFSYKEETTIKATGKLCMLSIQLYYSYSKSVKCSSLPFLRLNTSGLYNTPIEKICYLKFLQIIKISSINFVRSHNLCKWLSKKDIHWKCTIAPLVSI